MPRGMKKSHKGGRRQFTSAYNMAMEAEKNRRKQEWKSKKGLESDEDDETEGDGTEAEGSKKVVSSGSEEEEEEEESGSDEDEEDDEPDKPKGISHLIETKNPNRVEQKTKTVTEGEAEENPTLSRRERTELSKQQSKKRYWKLHEAGKTDQARADLARLALIRKEREEASKKREEEKKLQDGAKLVAEQKLLEKHKNV